MEKYINASPDQGNKFYQKFLNKGKVTMLNLLKFKTIADYSDLEHLKPKEVIPGEQAYQLYMENILPELIKAGSRIIYYGQSKDFLIGPESEKWDAVLVVEHESVTKFVKFARNKDFLKNEGHRTAALENSRLLPSTEIKNYN